MQAFRHCERSEAIQWLHRPGLLRRSASRNDEASCGEALKRGVDRKFLFLTRAAILELDHSVRQPARADDQLPGQADQVHARKLGSAPLVAVVVKNFDAGGGQLAVDVVRGGDRRNPR